MPVSTHSSEDSRPASPVNSGSPIFPSGPTFGGALSATPIKKSSGVPAETAVGPDAENEPVIGANGIKLAPGYGYGGRIAEIRAKEFSHVKETYLDHAGATLYPQSVITEYAKVLTNHAFGNPHTGSPTSDRTAEIVDRARLEVLNLLRANPRDYTVVFTQNASAAAKLVGEAVSGFPDIHYTYLKDAHTSLVGLRQLASSYAEFEDDIRNADLSMSKSRPVLVSWLGQSNFSGQRYPSADWARYLRAAHPRVYTLIDASALSTTAPPNLSEIQPDFVCLSFYKIFGHPDLGALIVRKDSGARFFAHRRYFGGGTIETVAPTKLYVGRMRDLHTQLEDGTVPFHSIIALVVAMAQFKFIFGSMRAISAHAAAVGQYAYDRLSALEYPNGRKLVHIYSYPNYLATSKQGPNMAFNLVDETGEWIGYTDLQDISAEQGISLRTGGLCNAGCTVKYSGMTDDDLILNHKHGHICGDGTDVVAGKVTGVVRISFGANSSKEDVDHLIQVLEDYYLNADVQKRIESKRTPEQLRIAKYGLEAGQPEPTPRVRRSTQPKHGRSVSMQPGASPTAATPTSGVAGSGAKGGPVYGHQRSGSRIKAYFTRFRRPTSMVAS